MTFESNLDFQSSRILELQSISVTVCLGYMAPLDAMMPIGHSYAEAQGFGEGPKNLSGLDIVSYLEWFHELGKPVVSIPLNAIPGSWSFFETLRS